MRPVRTRDERGAAFPSPLVMLSVVAVVMAGIAFVATRDQPVTEREVQAASQPAATSEREPTPTDAATTKPAKPKPKPIKRDRFYVVIFNNSGITGLAASAADRVSGAGWQVVGSDNWVGTIPASTVYYPERFKRAAELLARDLGIRRLMPAVDPMQMDRLTVILTSDFA